MDWTPLAATALGALVGVGSTLLADRARWRRDLADRTQQERRDIYVTVLTKYRLAYEAMHGAAVTARDQPDGVREQAVRQAFRDSGCDEARETALICAPQELSDLLEAVYATLRDLQEVFATGDPPLDSPGLEERRLKHAEAVWAARAAMRRDLGTPA
ncbi:MULTISPECIES: hypothetical protein [Streptomyces]|uniref:Secreted protein n=1 Tax=Streptomyces fuscus TaxID=3048495 RepID=A0ABT7J369_9ACTN|nr:MULTISPECIES: hypothetical protein [Streptomyces]MCM1968847.1 hypothetical protein [Streptomyces sp. G1]MDL2078807.1 hypothetical protein [Streptomyces fuscus]